MTPLERLEPKRREREIAPVTRFGSMGTTSHGLGIREYGGLPRVGSLDIRARVRRPITQ
jgi:hypothetical protein